MGRGERLEIEGDGGVEKRVGVMMLVRRRMNRVGTDFRVVLRPPIQYYIELGRLKCRNPRQ